MYEYKFERVDLRGIIEKDYHEAVHEHARQG